MYYNFVRIHKTLRVTPAMSAGITSKLMTMEDLVQLADAVDAARPRKKPGRKPKVVAMPQESN